MVSPIASKALGEVWMLVRDHRKLSRLALIQDASHRDIAAAVGWKSHSYVGRILRGEIKSVDPEAAVRMCHFFGVAVDDFFVSRSSKNAGHSNQAKGVRA